MNQSLSDQPLYLALMAQKSGQACDIGIESYFQYTDEEGSAFWTVSCNDGNSYPTA
jgi:hypothetical protein